MAGVFMPKQQHQEDQVIKVNLLCRFYSLINLFINQLSLLHQFVQELIDERKRMDNPLNDTLQTLIKAVDEILASHYHRTI